MSIELEKAACLYAHGVSMRSSSNAKEAIKKGFRDGAEWQQKQDEAVINNFFSRESVLELLCNYANAIDASLDRLRDGRPEILYMQFGLKDWFNANYPPKQ